MPRDRLLYLESDPPTAGAWELYLAGHGFDVVWVGTAERALRMAALSPPDAVLLGDVPDGLDPVQFAAKLRAVIGHDLVVVPAGSAHPRAVLRVLRRHTGSEDRIASPPVEVE
jgi:DNA-binding response OmpR family regulator